MAKVLLADESITIQKVVDLVLSEEGHVIKSVNSGDEALSAVQAFGPDIIIADVKIRGKNGYQIAQAIKGGQGTGHIPVLLLSGAFEPVDEKKLKESGADGSIVKPFESRDLIEKINELVKVSAAPVSADDQAGETEFEMEFGVGDEELSVEAPGAEEAAASAPPSEDDLWAIGDADFDAGEALEADIVEAETVQEAPAAPQPGGPGAPEAATPDTREFSSALKEALKEKLAEMTNGLDIKQLLVDAIIPDVKETVEKILWQVTPELTEKLLRDAVQESMKSLNKELENIIWETVPELAESIIKKEIEKIKAEF